MWYNVSNMNPATHLTNTDKFETSDIAIAAYLALTFIVDGLDFSDPQRVKFIFTKTPELERLVDDYWHKKALVEPQAYFMSMKVLKGRLYNEKPAYDKPYR